YIYPELYDSTLFRAREFQQYNRFTLKGSYKSATSAEISLGTFNLPQGSVRVSAGGRQLIEGQDYSVDYNIGKVRILNDAILQSGQNVSVSFEDNSLFGFQSRSMVGARLDYDLNKDVRIGATFMNLFERPLTQKVNFGDDPINNKVYGLDFNISKDAPWITKFVDGLPLIQTKEKSSITAQAEVALLDPGHNRAINQGGDKGGTVYLDDFEGSTSNLRVDFPANSWVLSSLPQGDLELFPESGLTDTTLLGVNRARLAWYNGDSYVRSAADNNNPYTITFNQQDIFPNRQLSPAEQSILRGLDVTFFPRERGPYNFELPNGSPPYSQGYDIGSTSALDGEPKLKDPKTRWAGFMKGLNTNDFEAANIEFVEFWMLNPYMDSGNGQAVSKSGDMYIDLGSVSEDIMRDSRQFFENAIPTGQGTGATVNTGVGRVPVLPPVVNAFDNDPAKRVLQDIGLDGLNDDGERTFFKDWVTAIQGSALSNAEKNVLLSDPSADNFVYFGDARYQAPNDNPGLIERYRRFNSPEGNSPVNNNQGGGLYSNPSATNIPDGEDLNRDNSLNESESYYRYKIPLKKKANGDSELDDTSDELKDLVTEKVVVNKNGKDYIWYRFKIPLDAVSRQQIGGIQDFRSIRFMRMLWKGFDEQTTFRFATLELGRNQWRRFTQPLPPDDKTTGCDVTSVNRIPFDVNA
ncbi:MAG: cell surface protein SprA, partial [Saprospiraceae bacterium]